MNKTEEAHKQAAIFYYHKEHEAQEEIGLLQRRLEDASKMEELGMSGPTGGSSGQACGLAVTAGSLAIKYEKQLQVLKLQHKHELTEAMKAAGSKGKRDSECKCDDHLMPAALSTLLELLQYALVLAGALFFLPMVFKMVASRGVGFYLDDLDLDDNPGLLDGDTDKKVLVKATDYLAQKNRDRPIPQTRQDTSNQSKVMGMDKDKKLARKLQLMPDSGSGGRKDKLAGDIEKYMDTMTEGKSIDLAEQVEGGSDSEIEGETACCHEDSECDDIDDDDLLDGQQRSWVSAEDYLHKVIGQRQRDGQCQKQETGHYGDEEDEDGIGDEGEEENFVKATDYLAQKRQTSNA